ncbi:MAG: hypothetical protein AAF728_06900 [Cyanobacteria bacterium P01_D01_bin.128]
MKSNNLKKILGVLSVATCLVAASGGNAYAIRIDFDEAELPGYGEAVTDQLQDDYGISFSATDKSGNNSRTLWLYDTDCDPNGGCTGGDPDLATGTGSYRSGGYDIEYNTPEQGNVLIIQEERNGNLRNNPDDEARGGWINVAFDQVVDFRNIGFLDLDDGDDPTFKFEFANGSTREWKFSDDDDEVSFVSSNGNAYSSKQTKNGRTTENANNSLRNYDFSGLSDENFNFAEITGFGVRLPSSGAIAYLEYFKQTPEKPASVPEPMSAAAFGLFTVGAFRLLKKKSAES